MRIDLGASASVQQTGESNSKKVSTANVGDDAFVTEDRTTLSSDKNQIKTLTAQALSSPEVRQDKVAALRQAVQSGQYKVSPGKIADSMLDNGF